MDTLGQSGSGIGPFGVAPARESTRIESKAPLSSCRCRRSGCHCDWFVPCLFDNGRQRDNKMRNILTTLTLVCLSGAAALAADANAGQAAFSRACKSCHGPDGTPNPAIAKMMKVDMQDLKSAAVQGMSNDDIKKIITDGKGKMRPITSVSGAALDDVAAYVHTLKK